MQFHGAARGERWEAEASGALQREGLQSRSLSNGGLSGQTWRFGLSEQQWGSAAPFTCKSLPKPLPSPQPPLPVNSW